MFHLLICFEIVIVSIMAWTWEREFVFDSGLMLLVANVWPDRAQSFPFLPLLWNKQIRGMKARKSWKSARPSLYQGHYIWLLSSSVLIGGKRILFSITQGLTFEHTHAHIGLHQSQHLLMHGHTHIHRQTHVSFSFIWPAWISSFIFTSH